MHLLSSVELYSPVAEIYTLESEQAARRRHLDDLFQSMTLHRAFSGELHRFGISQPRRHGSYPCALTLKAMTPLVYVLVTLKIDAPHKKRDLREMPAYGIAEAAHYLGIPKATLGS